MPHWIIPAAVALSGVVHIIGQATDLNGIGKLLLDLGALGVLGFLLWWDRVKTIPKITDDHKDACQTVSSEIKTGMETMASSVDKLSDQIDKHQEEHLSLLKETLENRK